MTDVQATKQDLALVADAPLSIVIVGIGNADFSAMVSEIYSISDCLLLCWNILYFSCAHPLMPCVFGIKIAIIG